MAKRRKPDEYVQSGAEDILTVAYRLEQSAAMKDRMGIQGLPTTGWMREQAKILRKALEKEGLNP